MKFDFGVVHIVLPSKCFPDMDVVGVCLNMCMCVVGAYNARRASQAAIFSGCSIMQPRIRAKIGPKMRECTHRPPDPNIAQKNKTPQGVLTPPHDGHPSLAPIIAPLNRPHLKGNLIRGGTLRFLGFSALF